MTFWEKNEDPWDIDPGKKRREPANVFESGTEPEDDGKEESFLDELAAMFKKKPVEEEAPQPPEKCPWCGQDMVKRYLVSGRDVMRLTEKKPSLLLGTLGHDSIDLYDASGWGNYKSCWYCKACRKLVADVPELSSGPNYVWEGGQVKLPEKETESQDM